MELFGVEHGLVVDDFFAFAVGFGVDAYFYAGGDAFGCCLAGLDRVVVGGGMVRVEAEGGGEGGGG